MSAEQGGCCGKCSGGCEKPKGIGDVECVETVPPLSPEAQAAAISPEQYRAIIEDLAQRLQTADAVILALLQKAGGEVVLTTADCEKVPGHVVANDVSEDRSTFTFRAVAVPQPVAQ